ncbi:MAG: hypothetical protein A4E71_02503 [Smithella sp. PtaU1.Bin162]|nr:MAG: hypothetical protein A4E71_02503 [Smithella sp. PtaU1.Bin162]
MKILSSILLLLFLIASIASAEVIDVNIKGMDDGRKTTRQQDYREAVMDAKLKAIEQAGVSIESITQVVNFQLKYDAVESKSKAVLLPGFQIIDIGYIADGTYQVVLIGKIQTGGKEASPHGKPTANETSRDGRFIAYDNGTVLDTGTDLMWASKDNGSNINWVNAKLYCKNYSVGGYNDWRLATQEELAGLYDKSKTYNTDCGDVHLTELIRLTCAYPWASETRSSGGAASFDFGIGKWIFVNRSHERGTRVLPVRSVK